MLFTCDLLEHEKEYVDIVETKDLEDACECPSVKFIQYNSNSTKNSDKNNAREFNKNNYRVE
jgi:hypothetical protein